MTERDYNIPLKGFTMTQEEITELLAKPTADYVAGAVKHACENSKHKIKKEKLLSLYNEYTQLSGELFIDLLEEKFHAHYQSQINILLTELEQYKNLNNIRKQHDIDRNNLFSDYLQNTEKCMNVFDENASMLEKLYSEVYI